MSVLLSWSDFEIVLFDADPLGLVDVFRVSARVGGVVFVEFFEAGSGVGLGVVVGLAVECLKDFVVEGGV